MEKNNNNGWVVGSSATRDGYEHAFLYSEGVMLDLDTLGGAFSHAYGVNDHGQVVGSSTTADGEHAFLYSEGVMVDIDPLGVGASVAYGINNAGQVVGSSRPMGGGSIAFLYSEGVMLDLNSLIDPTLGLTLTGVFGISDTGYIVGEGRFGGETHAFLLKPNASPPAVPEPSSILLLAAAGPVLLMGRHWRRRRIAGHAR